VVTIIRAVRPTGVVPQWLARPIALGGLVFFADALIYFVYRYAVTFGREVSGVRSTRAIMADVVLFSVFALHHSVFARDAFRKLITRIVGVLERSFYVWIASALFIAVCALWRPIAGVAWRMEQTPIVWAMSGAQLIGVWLTLRSAAVIDIRELAGLKQVTAARDVSDPANTTDASEFKTNGPYGWVRHPIYTGWFLLVFAVPVMTMTRLVFAVTSSLYLLIAIPLEERSLRDSSHGAYDRYMRQVPWKLVPRLF
jgi:protein-S-isoprenylcysteine O-methyltransferase Ste14